MEAEISYTSGMAEHPENRLRALLLLAAAVGLGGCASRPLERFSFEQSKMGSPFRIVLYAADPAQADAAAEAAWARIDQLNAILSDYEAGSELSLLGRLSDQAAPTAWISVSDDLWNVIEASQAISARTQGAFDITIGPYVRLWRRARRLGELPSERLLAEAAQAVGHEKLELDPAGRAVRLRAGGMRLDVGGIAKGYAAEEALKVLREHGVTRALVDAGGDIAVSDPPPGRKGWRVRLSMFDGPDGSPGQEVDRYILLARATVATSGDAHRFAEIDGVRYSHILDPRTGLGLTDRLAVTVIAPDGMLADALASAVSVLGAEAGLKLIDATNGAEALILTIDESGPRERRSRGFARYEVRPPGGAESDTIDP